MVGACLRILRNNRYLQSVLSELYVPFALRYGPSWRSVFLQHPSCVSVMIGRRSLGFTSLLLPAKAMQRPGIVPLSHSSLRKPKICPSQLRCPEYRSLNIFAMPLHTSNGSVIHCGLTRFVHGASCLHSLGFVFERHALGTIRFPFTNLWIWCWQRSWKYWKAVQNCFL